jgi:hypothetical protein
MSRQNEALRSYLDAGYRITQLDAFNQFGICRLSERIRELEASGYPINKANYKTPNGAVVKQYWKGIGEK